VFLEKKNIRRLGFNQIINTGKPWWKPCILYEINVNVPALTSAALGDWGSVWYRQQLAPSSSDAFVAKIVSSFSTWISATTVVRLPVCCSILISADEGGRRRGRRRLQTVDCPLQISRHVHEKTTLILKRNPAMTMHSATDHDPDRLYTNGKLSCPLASLAPPSSGISVKAWDNLDWQSRNKPSNVVHRTRGAEIVDAKYGFLSDFVCSRYREAGSGRFAGYSCDSRPWLDSTGRCWCWRCCWLPTAAEAVCGLAESLARFLRRGLTGSNGCSPTSSTDERVQKRLGVETIAAQSLVRTAGSSEQISKSADWNVGADGGCLYLCACVFTGDPNSSMVRFSNFNCRPIITRALCQTPSKTQTDGRTRVSYPSVCPFVRSFVRLSLWPLCLSGASILWGNEPTTMLHTNIRGR